MDRRMFLSLLLAAPAGAWGPGSRLRRYRADAVIKLLSVPIYSRGGVGHGRAEFGETSALGETVRVIEFSGASVPERAAGLRRLGIVRERVVERGGSRAEVSYFGVMTASDEKDIESARRALAATPPGMSRYTAISAACRGGVYRNAVLRFDAPYVEAGTLYGIAEEKMRAGPGPRESALSTPPLTFLDAVAHAIQDPSPRARREFVYGDKRYVLSTERTPDAGMASKLSRKGVVPPGTELTRLTGRIELGRQKTRFRVWIRSGTADLPLRIEFDPKSYLSLAFEAE